MKKVHLHLKCLCFITPTVSCLNPDHRMTFTVAFYIGGWKQPLQALRLPPWTELRPRKRVSDLCLSVPESEVTTCVPILSPPKAHRQRFSGDNEQSSTSDKMCSLHLPGFPAPAAGLPHSASQSKEQAHRFHFVKSLHFPQTFHFTLGGFY